MTLNPSSGTASAVAVTPDIRWKRWLRRVLLVVSCVCLILAVVTIWLRIQIDNTDRFVRTVDPVASDPAIQEAVVVAITDGFSSWLTEAQTRETLVDRERYLAAPLNLLLTDFVEKTARSVITSDEFQQFWVDAKQVIHPRLSAILTGSSTENMTTADGTISVDLAPLVQAVKNRLSERGVDIFDNLPSDRVDVSIVLVDSPELAEVQGLIDILFKLSVIFPLAFLLALGGYLWLSHSRRSGVIWAALAVALTMALLLVLLALSRWRYIDGLESDVNRAAATSFFDIITRYLRASVRLIAFAGLLVAGVAIATRPDGRVARWRIAAKRRLADGTHRDERGRNWLDPAWLERNRMVLFGGLVAVFCLFAITPDRITQGWGRAILIAAVVGLGLILLTSRFAKPAEIVPASASGPVPTRLARSQPPLSEGHAEIATGAGPATEAARETLMAMTENLSDADLKLLERVADALRDPE